jgi:hypothetical protein
VPQPRELAPGHLVACHHPLIESAPAEMGGAGGAAGTAQPSDSVPSPAQAQG